MRLMSKTYYPTIGLEIHAELKTETKMFCNSKNDPDEDQPNVNICPVCMAHPGTLPVINKKAVEYVIKVGLAIGGKIANFTEFDRKNYFYPDIPKGYQISQYKYPIVSGGELNGVKVTRIHLEEDTANSKHDRGDYSLVDFNRAGVPLMELVTEPVINSAEEAGAFARELQLLLRYLGVSDANMEKGQMRVEANISISENPEKFGTKVEVKNLNSFKAAESAIKYELVRMENLMETGRGDEIVQETRGWDENKGETFSQRKKESSHDYRYFPDPDLPKLKLSEVFNIDEMRTKLPELPWQKREILKQCEISNEAIEIFVENTMLGEYFENVIKPFGSDMTKIKLASNYITSDIMSHLKNSPDVSLPQPTNITELINMIIDGKISSRGAKDILEYMHGHDDHPMKIAEEKGLIQQSDESAIKSIVEKVMSENETVVAEYKGGRAMYESIAWFRKSCYNKKDIIRNVEIGQKLPVPSKNSERPPGLKMPQPRGSRRIFSRC
ncbi:MAG: Aspartyl/glutamyl-tRNA(Asn/Gln) amidotransferase subunit B [Candidatus Nomurabacteria bacterium GW2011_GWB1_37_5]|uniref:Aspartyl/glutamyl-tRNA(Asn/Gln) amidotransferase subunit B n=1 Tax=Candidatus Nomurabacteria bacterium GW2011_GWB1_37_5 TaxID=1618742 RepID=A0A0G0GTM0_9BACT|nr:MAG: Aspartyl/glutamyl-tRNA(Asn/Gln) amidotransferase subunit B [Candidatus Nomurabacteria bacterium GW2011_GWB1_37_5]